MCTIILAHRLHDDAPILLGANRDERFGRPAEPPELRDDGELAVVAPRDLKAGGTWLGVNAAGVVVAITNRFGRPADPERRSRGELVSRALGHRSAAAAAGAIAALDGSAYNPFHLLMVDERDAYLVWSDGDFTTKSRLEEKLLVLTERSLGASTNARKERVLQEVRALADAGQLDESHLQEVLSRGPEGSIDATCVRLPSIEYGTRSSTIIRLGEQRSLWHAEGAPCEVAYEDQSALLDELLAR